MSSDQNTINHHGEDAVVSDRHIALTKQTPFELPNEVILHIFRYLPLSAFKQTPLVCRLWALFSTDDYLWEQLCFDRDWEKSDETQTWNEYAKVRIGLFCNGIILNISPRITSASRLTSKKDQDEKFVEAGITVFKTVDASQAYFIEGLNAAKDTIIIVDAKAKGQFSLSYSSPICGVMIDDDRVVTGDRNNDVQIRDIKTGNLIAIHHIKTDNFFRLTNSFELKSNVLISCSHESLGCWSKIEVHHLDKPEEDYSHTIRGEVTCMALQGNILACCTYFFNVFEVIGVNTIRLIDLKKRRECTYLDSFAPHSLAGPILWEDQMLWRDHTLYIERTIQKKNDVVIVKLDF